MTKELADVKATTRALREKVEEDGREIDRLNQSLDTHVRLNHFAELIMEAMRTKDERRV